MSCAVKGCSNCRRLCTENISFHTFPREGKLQMEWLKVLNIDKNNWKWSKNKVVCSNHFNDEDCLVNSGRRTLKPDTIPCLNPKKSTSDTGIQDDSSLTGVSSIEYVFEEPSENHDVGPKQRNEELIFSDASQTETRNTSSNTNNRSRRKIMVVNKIPPYNLGTYLLISKRNNGWNQREMLYRKKLYRATRLIKSLRRKVEAMKQVIKYLKRNCDLSDTESY